jgi:hypothetical protein
LRNDSSAQPASAGGNWRDYSVLAHITAKTPSAPGFFNKESRKTGIDISCVPAFLIYIRLGDLGVLAVLPKII